MFPSWKTVARLRLEYIEKQIHDLKNRMQGTPDDDLKNIDLVCDCMILTEKKQFLTLLLSKGVE